MGNREKISSGIPFDGDIVSVMESVYDDSLESLKVWKDRFVTKKRFYLAKTVRNNGAIWARDVSGRYQWLSVKDVADCYRRCV